MNCHSMSQPAPKYVKRENKSPVKTIKVMDMRNTRRAPKTSFKATRSAVMIDMATGTPACEILMAKK